MEKVIDNRKISIAIPTWDRVDLLINSFRQVLDDERVSDIHISEDASDLKVYNQIKSIVEVLNKTHGNKITLTRNLSNVGCYVNKRNAIFGIKNDWGLILDSDNSIDKSFIDKLYEEKYWLYYRIYAPDYAKPNFNYKEFGGCVITKENVHEYIDRPMFLTALNTFNFFIQKEMYLRTFDATVEPVTADSIYFNYCWLAKGGSINFIKDLEYDHLVHAQSHYRTFNHLTGNFYNETVNKLRQLK